MISLLGAKSQLAFRVSLKALLVKHRAHNTCMPLSKVAKEVRAISRALPWEKT